MAKPKPLDFQNFPFPMVGGLDTKVASVSLPAPKLQICQNAYADKTGSLKKRAGYLQLSSNLITGSAIATPIALASYKDNQVAFSNNNAYEYSSVAGRWIDKGAAYSFRVRVDNLVNGNASVQRGLGAQDIATAGSLTVVAAATYAPSGANTTTNVVVTVTDADGTVLKNEKQLYTVTAAAGEFTAVRCIALGVRVYVFYFDSSAAALKVWILDTTSASTINTSLNASAVSVATDINTTTPIYDVAVGAASTQVWVVYRMAGVTTMKLGFVTTAGALVDTTTHVPAATPVAVAAAVNATTGHGFVFAAVTSPNDFYAVLKTFSGGVWASVTASGAIETTLTTTFLAVALGCLWETSTTFRMWYSTDGANGNVQTFQSTYTTGGVATARVQTLRHSCLASKPFTGTDGNFYYWAFAGAVLTIVQPTLFLMRHDNTVVAWANQDVAYYPYLGTLPQVQASGTSTYTTVVPFLNRIVALGASGTMVGTGTQIGLRTIAVDMTHAQSHKTVEVGDSLYMAGGFLQQYDGAGFVESGFLRFCSSTGNTGEAVTLASSNTATGGLTSSAQYSYIVVPEWTNIRGEREQGTHNGSISITLGVADDTVTVTIPTIPYTLKKSPRSSLVFAIYRTGPNPTSDAEFNRCGTVENSLTADTVSFVDTVASVTTQESFYQDGGVLENIAPPSGYILAQGGGRVWVAGLSDDKHQVVASKLRGTGEPVAGNDTLVVQVPELGGAITALEFMNEQLVIFKESRIYVLPRGGGPNGETGMNNLGTGVFLVPELVIAADTGCVTQRSVLATPMGLMFQGTKGMMLLDPSLQVHYIGAPLETFVVFATGVITGAVLMPGFQQARFSTADGGLFVFDYYHKIWSTFTPDAAAMTTAQGGKCVLLHATSGVSDGGVWLEDAATYSDNGTAFLMKVRLAWVASQEARQASLRFRWVALLFTASQAATARMQVRANYQDSTVTQTVDAVVTTDTNRPLRQQVRINSTSQLASALQIEIDDQSATTASLVLHQVDFNMAARRGLGRVGASF